MSDEWKLFKGTREPRKLKEMPTPPPWRPYRDARPQDRRADATPSPAFVERGTTFQATDPIVEVVNAALYLRRPILVTGNPGTGKSSLVDAVAYELGLGEPLRWAVTSRSTLKDALYRYDALGRLQELQVRDRAKPGTTSEPTGKGKPRSNAQPPAEPDIGDYLELGPLGTALLPSILPRALLIDEIDKADIDLPNDLLNVFEEGEFEIPELSRLRDETASVRRYGSQDKVKLTKGRVRCYEFPFVVMTSNGERDFPAPFLRRCLRLSMPDPWGDATRVEKIVRAHFEHERPLAPGQEQKALDLINGFIERARGGTELLATDQLLNAIYLVTQAPTLEGDEKSRLVKLLTQALNVQRS